MICLETKNDKESKFGFLAQRYKKPHHIEKYDKKLIVIIFSCDKSLNTIFAKFSTYIYINNNTKNKMKQLLILLSEK